MPFCWSTTNHNTTHSNSSLLVQEGVSFCIEGIIFSQSIVMFTDLFFRNLLDLFKNKYFLIVFFLTVPPMEVFYFWVGIENLKRANAALEGNIALGYPVNVSSSWQGYHVEVAPSVGVAPKADIPPVPGPGPLDQGGHSPLDPGVHSPL